MPEATITLTPEEVDAVLALREEARRPEALADGGDDDGDDGDDLDDGDDGECPDCGALEDEEHDIDCSFYGDDDDDMEDDLDDDEDGESTTTGI